MPPSGSASVGPISLGGNENPYLTGDQKGGAFGKPYSETFATPVDTEAIRIQVVLWRWWGWYRSPTACRRRGLLDQHLQKALHILPTLLVRLVLRGSA